MTILELEERIKDLTHAEIADLREELKSKGDKTYLARILYYDYDKQVWIEPNRI